MALIYEKREVVLNFKEEKPTVYRIAPVKQQHVTFNDLLNDVSNACGVSRAQTKAAIEGMLDRMMVFMNYGLSIKLGDFGTFKPTFNVKSQTNVEDLGADNIMRKKILFYPGKRFRTMLENIAITNLGNDEVAPYGSSGGGNSGGGNNSDGGNEGEWVDPSV